MAIPDVPDHQLAQRLKSVTAALDRSDRPLAISLARSALTEGLVHPLFLNLRAFWLEGRGRTQEALADLQHASKLAPDDVPVLNALGLALARLEQPVEATKAFERAAALDPNFAPAHFNRGWASEMWGEVDQARKSYERALELTRGQPGAVESVSRLAALAHRRGDWNTAATLVAEALRLNPSHPIALLTQARVDIEHGRFEAAESGLQQILCAPSLPRFDRYWAMGALGDLRHAQGRYEEAFRVYVDGNEAYRRSAPRRYQTGESAIDAIRWTDQYYKNLPAAPPSPERPTWAPAEARCQVFLVGFIRSGTTLLEQALAAHRDVVTMEEKEAFGDSAPIFLANPAGLDRLRSLQNGERATYAQAYWQRVREQGFEPAANKVFVDKHPFNTLKLPLIAELFPGAKVIFAIRDPRDVILSCMRRRLTIGPLTYQLLSLEPAALFYDAYMQLALRLRHVLPLEFHCVRHEDVVEDFGGEVRKVCSFLGMDWSDDMHNFAERQRARTISSPSAAQIAKGLNREGVGQWRHYRKQLAPVLPVLASWVKHYGYAPD